MLEVKRNNGKIYSHIREKWLVETPEEAVRQEFVCLLVNDFGYPLNVMVEEYRADYVGRGAKSTRADIVIYKSIEDKQNDNNSFIVVECKAQNVKIRQEDFYQGTEYVAKTRGQFLVLHNSKETHYYSVDMDKIPNKKDAFKQIVTIPEYKDINNQKVIDDIKSKTKAFTRKEFTDLLFACHNIIRNNDKLSPEAAFDEISKILFIKINYERNEQGKSIFTKKQYLHNKSITEESDRINQRINTTPYMQTLFENTKERYKDDKLFEDNEEIKIRENSFEAILEKLQIYNLSDTSDDIKGIAFEEFLGKTFRGELGQFFTPRTIVNFMTEILDPVEGETICDPTCGSGGFLIKSFEYIREKIENEIEAQKEVLRLSITGEKSKALSEKEQITLNDKIEAMQATLNKELDHLQENSRMYRLSHQCIYGTDANPRMARVSKMNMIMHGDGHGGVHHHDGLLNVNGIYNERFDVILTNPPFGARVDKTLKITTQEIEDAKDFGKQEYIDKNGKNKNVIDVFETGKMSALTEVLFMERCLKLLKKGGRMGMVLPEGVLNTSNLQKVREYFEGKAKLVLICSIPQDVFIAAGATVKPSLVFFKRFTQEEEEKYQAVSQRAISEIRSIYNDEIVALKGELAILIGQKSDRVKQGEIRKRLAEIETSITLEAKPLIKQYFDYEIPIAKVEKAGITTTGAVCENELVYVRDEFGHYNNTAKLWEVKTPDIFYTLSEDGVVVRTEDGKECRLVW